MSDPQGEKLRGKKQITHMYRAIRGLSSVALQVSESARCARVGSASDCCAMHYTKTITQEERTNKRTQKQTPHQKQYTDATGPSTIQASDLKQTNEQTN